MSGERDVFGMLSLPGVFSSDECEQLSAQMDDEERRSNPGEVGDRGVVPTVRHVSIRGVKRVLRDVIAARFQELIPALNHRCDAALSGFQPPEFLRYEIGQMYCPHRDRTDDADHPAFERQRVLTAIGFLDDNDLGQEHSGGELFVFGLVPGFEEVGLEVPARLGSVAVFRSEMIHEVKPVTSGVRHTIATWFE